MSAWNVYIRLQRIGDKTKHEACLGEVGRKPDADVDEFRMSTYSNVNLSSVTILHAYKIVHQQKCGH